MIPSSRALHLCAVVVLAASCIGCDQLTKHVAQARLKGRPDHSYLGDVVRLQYAENPGAFLGLGGRLPPMARWVGLILVNIVIAVVLAGAMVSRRDLTGWRLAACALLLSGALGNLIDRVRFDGLVIDFMNLGIGPLRTGIFNVADVAITLGACLLVLSTTSFRTSAMPPQQA